MSKIIIFGLDDLLTYQISKTLTEESESTVIAVTTNNENEDYECDKSFIIDFENNEEFSELINSNIPDIIINTMILSDDENSIASNIDLYFKYLNRLIDFAKRSNALFIQFSTARVFSGKKGNYSEDDLTDAEDKYGIEMISAERLISKTLDIYAIIRFSEFFGANDNYSDFVNTYLSDLDDKLELKIDDITFNPLFINDLTYFLYFLIEKNKTGIFHIGSNNHTKLSKVLIKASQILEIEDDCITFVESDKDYSLNIFKSEAEQIYKFSSAESYLITMKHFNNVSNKFYNTKK